MIQELRDRLTQTLQEQLDAIVAFLPGLVLGIVLIVVALVVAKGVERILRMVMTRIRVDDLVQSVGIDSALQSIGVRGSLNAIVPRIVYFLLLFLFAQTAADALGLEAISGALSAFLGYLPNIVAAVLILVLGSSAAQVVGQAVERAAGESGIDFAASLGSVVSALVLFVIGIMAIGQLKIDTEMIRLVTTGLMAGGALAFGLSFGLGSREVTRDVLAGFYARQQLVPGDTVQVDDVRGVLLSVGPTQTLIEVEGDTVAVANRHVQERVRSRQAD